jgi:putative PIN family toxin of toxin-antitoxin system
MGAAPARPARIILDANILVSAVIASGRASGSALGQTVDRAFEGLVVVIACPRLLTEVERALRSQRLVKWVRVDEVAGAMEWIIGGSRVVPDPDRIIPACRDPADDYPVALARRELATIVTGDNDLLSLQGGGIDVIAIGELAATLRA